MAAFSDISSKILAILKKTQEAILVDITSEFYSEYPFTSAEASVTIQKPSDVIALADQQLVRLEDFVDAVFIKLGIDFTCPDSECIKKLKGKLTSIMKCIDALSDSFSELTGISEKATAEEKGDAVAEFIEKFMPALQDLLNMIREISEDEAREAEKYCEEAGKELEAAGKALGTALKTFDYKALIRRIVDYVLMTLLKNAKEVFADEIEFIELKIRLGKEAIEKLIDNVENELKEVESQIKDTAKYVKQEAEEWYNNAETTVESLESDLKKDFRTLSSRLSKQCNKTGTELQKELNRILESDAIITATRVMSNIYAIMDFLGIINEKKIELKLPDAAVQALSKTKDAIQSGLSEVGEAANKVSSKADTVVTTLDSVKGTVSKKLEDSFKNAKDFSANTLNDAASVLNSAASRLHISQASTYTAALQLATMQIDDAGNGLGKDLNDAYDEIRKGANHLSGDVKNAANTINNKITDLNGRIDQALTKVTGFSYSVSVPVIQWDKIEMLFTHPVKHFKQLYQIESKEDAMNVLEKFMNILHGINPDIPDFSSLISMLETLLKKIKAKAIELVNEVKEKAKEKANELKTKIVNLFKPLIEKIENLIKLLKQVANQLKDKAEYVVKYIKTAVQSIEAELKDAVEAYYQQISKIFDSSSDELSSIAKTAQKKVNKAIKDINDSASEASKLIKQTTSDISKQASHGKDAVEEVLRNKIQHAQAEAESLGNKLINALTDIKIEVPALSSFDIKSDVLIPAFSDLINIDWDDYSVDASQATDAAASALSNSQKMAKELQKLISTTFNSELDTLVSESKNDLQAWATAVATSIKTVTDANVWKERLDNVLTALQAEMKTDMNAIRSLVSVDGVKNLYNNFDSTTSSLAKQLDINSYVNILRTAVEDVVLPNPELYYQSFKEVILKIVDKIKKFFSEFIEKLEKELTAGANKVVGSISELKGEAKDLWNELVEKIKKFNQDVVNPEKLGNIVNNLLTLLWKRIKEQLIMPIITSLKNTVISVIRKVVRVFIEEILDTILEKIEQTTNNENVKNFINGVKEAKSYVNVLKENGKEIYEDGQAIIKAINEKDLNTLGSKAKEAANLAWKNLDSNVKREIENKVQSISKDMEDLGIEVSNAIQDTQEKAQEILNNEYVQWTREILLSTSNYLTSDMKLRDTLALVFSIYKSMPREIHSKLEDMLPNIKDNDFYRYCRSLDFECDLNNKFACVTLIDLSTLSRKEEKKDSATKFNAKLLVQASMRFTEYSYKENAEDEDEKSVPAILFSFAVQGALGLSFYLGDNHSMAMGMEGSISEIKQLNSKEKTEKTEETEQSEEKEDAIEEAETEQEKDNVALGFYLTKKVQGRRLHGKYDTGGMGALFYILFQREKTKKGGKGEVQPAKWIDSKYIELTVKNYPQIFYIGYNPKLKDNAELTAVLSNRLKDLESRTGFQVGYLASIEGLNLLVKLRENKLLSQLLKDDISVDLDTYIGYDMQQGLVFGGDYQLHLDFDINNLKLGNLTLNNLGLDLGSKKNNFGSFILNFDSNFQINFEALTMSFEGLGLGFDLSFLKPDHSVGDWDFGCNFNWPTGIGINIDCPALNGLGLISFDKSKGECMGVLSLTVIDKFGVSAFLLMDTGELPGHTFSLVAMISAQFSPGIPLGMGFSLTAIGGCLGLNRCIDREGLIKGTRQGTLASVFFVKDVQNHLSEMKEAAVQFFPSKKNQFFLGLLGQIKFEPIVSCDFGLILQLPNPIEIIIIGALKVSVGEEADDLIRINVYFAGGINFAEGIWFDASIIDSKIIGISLAGDIAFRLFWGGKTKGFLLSIGGFHPDYHPEEGMMVSNMKRLSMGLNYDILKINLAAYLAVTSNSFQIGAQLDLKVGWSKFGISGYAGFDALFQWDPFLFAFNLRAGVAVVCGNWKLLSIDLSLDVKGPKPWYVKGDARFWFLFIPIHVDFELSWGGKSPELPSAEVSIRALLEDTMTNPLNWKNNESFRDKLVILAATESEDEDTLILSPCGTLTFNQSRVPLKTEVTADDSKLETMDMAELLKMDLCDNARPNDYSIIEVTSVSLGSGAEKEMTVKDGTLEMLTNDFAPSLYIIMGLQEKLLSKSYVQYNSGFEVDGGKQPERTDEVEVEVKVMHYLAKDAKREEAKACQMASAKTRNIKQPANDKLEYDNAAKGISAIVGGLNNGLSGIIGGLQEYKKTKPIAEGTLKVRLAQPARRDRASFNNYIKELEKRR